MCRLLASKNLPAAIEDTSGNELPESIREKAAAVQSQGGAAALEAKIHALPELLQRNREIINEVGVVQSATLLIAWKVEMSIVRHARCLQVWVKNLLCL